MLIRRLEPSDRRDSFACGVPALDEFLIRHAGQNQFVHHIGVTYVTVDDASRQVLGFVTVAAAHVRSEQLAQDESRALPNYPLPVLRVARMAVDERVQGVGIGSALLGFACNLALAQAEQVGCVGLIADAKPEAVEFYERYGFKTVSVVAGASSARPRQPMMFLSLKRVRAAQGQASARGTDPHRRKR